MFQGVWNEILAVPDIIEARKINLIPYIVIVDQHDLLQGYFERFSIDILANIFNITRTQTHECIICSDNDWIDFISDSCYSLNCEDGKKSWTEVDGKKQTFLDWMATATVRYDSKYIFERSS
jgi:hypothetical protein